MTTNVDIARAAETAILALLTPGRRAAAQSRAFRMRLEPIIASIVTLIHDTERGSDGLPRDSDTVYPTDAVSE